MCEIKINTLTCWKKLLEHPPLKFQGRKAGEKIKSSSKIIHRAANKWIKNIEFFNPICCLYPLPYTYTKQNKRQNKTETENKKNQATTTAIHQQAQSYVKMDV